MVFAEMKCAMETQKIILVYDRNPNIRQFLKRELSQKGYKVRVAKTPQEAMKYAYWPIPADAIVMDPEGIYKPLPDFINELEIRVPAVPIIFHDFNVSETKMYIKRENTSFVEKCSESIENIIRALDDIFGESR